MTDCDVCIGSDDIETLDFSYTTFFKARCEVKCCECGRVVQRGETYEKVVGGWFDYVFRYRTCTACVEIRDVFSCDKSFMYESLWEDMREYAFERLTTASPCFVKLSAAAKARVLEEWQKWKGLAGGTR